jgi:hypothetical protein
MTTNESTDTVRTWLNRTYILPILNDGEWYSKAKEHLKANSRFGFNRDTTQTILKIERENGDDLDTAQVEWLKNTLCYRFIRNQNGPYPSTFVNTSDTSDPPLNRKTSQATIKSTNASIYTQYLIASKVWKDNASMFIKGHDIADFVDYSNRCLDIRTKELDLESLTPTERSQILAELRQFAIDKYLPKETNIMNTTPFSTKQYVFGIEVSTMTEDQLIDSIKKIEKEIAELSTVKIISTKVKQNIGKLHEALRSIVAILDAKA